MSRRPAFAGLALLGVCALLVAGALGRATVTPTSDGAMPRPLVARGEAAPPRRVGPTDPGAPIDLSLVLRLPDAPGLEAYLDGLADPSSPRHRRYLTAADFGARFGAPDAALQHVIGWAATAGFEVSPVLPQRTSIALRGSAALVNGVFDISLVDLVDVPTGIRYRGFDGEPAIPDAIAAEVEAIAGIGGPPAVSTAVAQPLTSLSAPLEPGGLAAAYDIGPLQEAGVTGAPFHIAIVSFDTFTASDVEEFDRKLGLTSPPVERISVGPRIREPGPGSGEVTLDIDVIRMVAPGARILNFEGPNGVTQLSAILDAIVADGRAQIVSTSWGHCDSAGYMADGQRLADTRALQAMVAAGISLFSATGDWGAFTCWAWSSRDHRETTWWPATSEYVVAVGGTNLTVREDGGYGSEAGWEDWLSTFGTGGGLSREDLRPAWQVGLGVANERSDGRRQIPDVSATADLDSGYLVYWTDPETGQSTWSGVGGTSASAPFWAAFMVLIQESAARLGLGPLGYVNPMLYAIAAASAPGAVFHDVVIGGNLSHRATPGWDFATGIGTPDVTALAAAIADHLRANPPP